MGVKRWYPSKVDAWLAVALAMAPLMTTGAVVGAVIAGDGVWIAALAMLFIVALYAGLVVPMRYGMDDTHVIVRHGLVRQRIPLAAITEVSPTRNPLSSPALSLDRIEIKFGDGFFKSARISPEPRAEFLEELAIAAHLRRHGDRLVR